MNDVEASERLISSPRTDDPNDNKDSNNNANSSSKSERGKDIGAMSPGMNLGLGIESQSKQSSIVVTKEKFFVELESLKNSSEFFGSFDDLSLSEDGIEAGGEGGGEDEQNKYLDNISIGSDGNNGSNGSNGGNVKDEACTNPDDINNDNNSDDDNRSNKSI